MKIHPFSFSGEDQYFRGGEEIKTFTLPHFAMDGQDNKEDQKHLTFTTFICYDLRFPELFRLVAGSVDAVIIPANWPARCSKHWKALLKAHAIENQVYIFAINCFGDMGGQYYSGDSCVINPDGEVLLSLSDQEGTLIFDLQPDVGQYRNSFPVLKDRREDIYREINRKL